MPEHVLLSRRGRLLAAAMVVALAAVSYTIWTSPQARRVAGSILTAPLPERNVPSDPPAAVRKTARPDSPTSRSPVDPALARMRAQLAALQGRVASRDAARSEPTGYVEGGTSAGVAPAGQPAARHRPTGGSRVKHCWDFRWQQDAQAAYLANLFDPWGLDGPPGPHNGDGLACSDLPIDPRRPPSTPAGAKQQPMPTAPPIDALRQPQQRYFGLYTEQSPYSWSEVDLVSRSIGKVPSMVGYFGAGDQPFRSDAVIAAWRRGMLPFFTWELRPQADMGQGGTKPRPGYSLAEIANGSLDGYLRTYAHDVAAVKLPLAIRLDHEMNGYWYPWSVYPTMNPGGPTDYVRMWRHVHDVFAQAGATNVIWVWSPNRITYSLSDFSDFYPGDAYVDWIGVSGYYRNPSDPPTFDGVLGPSLRALRDTTAFPHAPKPIVLSETGATEGGGHKAVWITDMFNALNLPENADVIGFCWFNYAVTTGAGGPGAVTNDWRVTSSTQSIAAFSAGIADPRYAGGH